MPSRSFSGSSQSMSASAAVATTAPLWFSCWFSPAVVTGARALLGIFSSTGSNGWYLSMESATPTKLSFVADQAGSFALATTANTCAAGQWCHAYGQVNSGTDRTVVLNGDWTNRGTNATSNTPGSLALTVLGAFMNNGSPVSTWNGLISQVCIGRGQLTPSEVFALARGASPWDIRPNNILLWLPLGLGSTIEIDPTNRFRTPLANTGATFSAREPPLLLPQKSRRFQLANTAAAFKARYYYEMVRAA